MAKYGARKLIGGPCDGWVIAQDEDTFDYSERAENGWITHIYENAPGGVAEMFHMGVVGEIDDDS